LVEIAGRAYNDSLFPHDTGRYLANVTADGYQAERIPIEVRSLDTALVEINWRPINLAQGPAGPQPGRTGAAQPPAVAVPRDSGEIRMEVSPLRTAVTLLPGNTPLGTGRFFRRLPVGRHTLRYSAAGCSAIERTVDIKMSEPLFLRDSLPGCR
jgi:hypothetical protein